MCSAVGPVMAIGVLGLCCWRRTRRTAMVTLAFGCAAAALATVWFHFVYVMPIWKGHPSAIWFLDRGAFSAAFAIATCGGGIAALAHQVFRRGRRIENRS